MGWPGFQLRETWHGWSFIQAWCILHTPKLRRLECMWGGIAAATNECGGRRFRMSFREILHGLNAWEACLVHVWVHRSNTRGRAVGTPVIKHPPDQRQWTRHECKDPVFSSTPHMNGHYSERFVKIYAMYTGDTPHIIHPFSA